MSHCSIPVATETARRFVYICSTVVTEVHWCVHEYDRKPDADERREHLEDTDTEHIESASVLSSEPAAANRAARLLSVPRT